MPISVTRMRVPQAELRHFVSRRSNSAKASIESFAATFYWLAYFYNKVS